MIKKPSAIIVAPPTGELSTELAEALEQSREFANNSRANNTISAYKSDWKLFLRWCKRHRLVPMPASEETVKLYFTQLSKGTAFPDERPPRGPRKISTIRRHAATISVAHRIKKQISPIDSEDVQAVLLGIQRTAGGATVKKTAAVRSIITEMVRSIDDEETDGDLRDRVHLRDRSIVLTGFGGALRRSEIVGLDHAHVEFRREGMILTIFDSKTDKTGEGQVVRVNTADDEAMCPVRSLRRWMDELKQLGLVDGAIYRSFSNRNKFERLSGAQVARIIKKAAEAIGRDPRSFAGHSLRSGHVTTAIRDGKRLDTVQKQTRHKVMETLLGYLEREGSWDDNSSSGLL